MTQPKLNETERRVLEYFVNRGISENTYFTPFAPIMRDLELDRKAVRRACRSLKRKNLTVFESGLYTYDGDMAGSGYAATNMGVKLIEQLEEERDGDKMAAGDPVVAGSPEAGGSL